MDKNEDTDMKSRYIPAINFIKNEQVPGFYLKAAKGLYQEELKYGLGDHTRVLKEVVIKAQPKPKVPHSSNLNGPGNANQIITGDDLYKNFCLNLDDCLAGRLTGVLFHDGLPYSTRGGYSGKKPIPMLLVLDGVPQDTNNMKETLSRIQPSEVSSIEVLRDPGYIAIYGSRGINGVIIITTKRAEDYLDANVAMDNSALVYSPKGYYRAREFYSPQYDDPKTNQAVADLRTTIFWKPNINTDKNGHAFFEYYNAGSPGVYRVIIEGIDGDGHIGREVYRYKVE
jgi:TonB-dependent SusC/RagA subfamily outer membrane receptor